MSKRAKRKIILIDGIRYYADRPDTCRKCFFWKNRKVGCILGKQNCYYLAEAVMTAQEMLRHTKTLGIVQVDDAVWKKLTKEEKAEVDQICDQKLAAYFERMS